MRLILSLLLCLAARACAAEPDLAGGSFGKPVSEKALVRVSSTCQWDTPETHLNLVRGPQVPCAFHTASEQNPHVILKLPAAAEVKALEIVNRKDGSGERTTGLVASLSEDGKTWTEVWKSDGPAKESWTVPLTNEAGHGKKAAYVRLELKNEKKQYFHLSRVTVYGK